MVPWEVIDQHGADAFRWYYFTSKQPWDGYRFSLETVGEAVRQFMLQLWNTYGFYVLYANANGIERETPVALDDLTELDRWALSRLEATTATVTERLDDYDTTTAGRAIAALVDDLSNWYVRLSRRRFWDGDPAAFGVLRTCLVQISKLLAPLTPFIADELFENLDGSEPSVHLCDFPAVDASRRDQDLEWQMQVARDAVELGRAARAQAKVKMRQPLPEAVIVAADKEKAAIEHFQALVADELNVKSIRYVSEADELGRFELKANYRTLGPRFGKEMPQLASAIASLDASHVAETLRAGSAVGVNIGGKEHRLGEEDIQLALQPLEGYQVEAAGTHAVALGLELDDGLRQEGLAREIVHAVQGARKDAGLDISDRISLAISGDEAVVAAARAHEGYLTGEVLATSIAYGGDEGVATEVDGHALQIGVERA